jgi:hypothetical protein
MASGQEISFIGGINTDDDVRFISEGDYRSSSYMRSGSAEAQNAGSAESMPGNLLIDNPNLPSGMNTVIGSARWVENNSIVYFVHNVNGDHTLWSYDVLSHQLTIVLGNLESAGGSFNIPNFAGSTLNLDRDYPIFHANVVDNILYWTDNYNPPRKLDLNKAIKYMESGGTDEDGYSFLSFGSVEVGSKTIDVLKAPPLFVIEAEYATDTTRNFNKLYGNQYQFRYQYVYENNEESKWSMISKQPFPNFSEFVSGRNTIVSLQDNIINLTYRTGPKNVKQINFAYRRGENGNWLVFKQLDLKLEGVSNLTTATLVFDDNTAPSGATLTDILYDNVPQVAKCQEILPNQSLAYGNFYADYDLVQDLDIQADRVLHELYEASNNTRFNLRGNTFRGTTNPMTTKCYFQISEAESNFWYYEQGDVLVFSLKEYNSTSDVNNSYNKYYYEITLDDVQYGSTIFERYQNLFNNIKDDFNIKYPGIFITVGYDFSLTYYEITFNRYLGTVNSDVLPNSSQNPTGDVWFSSANILRSNQCGKSLKKGSKKVFGIQYYDRGNRSNTVQTIPSMVLQIPLPGQEDRSQFEYNINIDGFGSQSAYTVSSKFTINNLPPDWATHYSILVKKDELISSFMQTTITRITEDISINNLRLQLDKSPASTSSEFYTSVYPGATFYHTPSKGDRVRIISGEYFKNPVPNSSEDSNQIIPSIYTVDYQELEVLSYDSSTNEIVVNSFDFLRILGGNVDGIGSLIEIYTPKRDVIEDIWYEIEKYDIYTDEVTGAKYHAANGQSQTTSQPAILESDYGDVYYRKRNYATGIVFKKYATYQDMLADTSSQNENVISWNNDNDPSERGTYTYTLFYNRFFNSYFNRYNSFNSSLYDNEYFYLPDMVSRFYFIEDYNYSDYYTSDGHGRGRIGIENNKTQRTHYKTGVIHSAPYVMGSFINGLSSFDTLGNAEYLDDTYGPINRLKQVGYTLKALQDRKEVSIYIQRSYATSADGSGQLAYTSKVFGGINPSDSMYGCIHPGSVQVIENNMYYYDFYTGAVIRSSNNGQVDITANKYKFNYWITKKTNEIGIPEQKIINGKVYYAVYTPISFVDETNSEYYLNFTKVYRREEKFEGKTFVYDSNEAPVFDYSRDRWRTFVYFPLIWGENLGASLYTFAGANLYEQNVPFLADGTPNELNFFGEQEKMTIEFVMNDMPILIKRPLSIGFRSNKPFSVPEINTLGNASYPAMLSKLFLNNFKLKEGYWWAAYLRDMNTPNQTPDNALVNGRQLRSYAIIHRAEYEGNEKAVLFDIKCSYVPSEALI